MSAAFLASSASEGRETLTSLGACGEIDGARRSRTEATDLSWMRVYTVVGLES